MKKITKAAITLLSVPAAFLISAIPASAVTVQPGDTLSSIAAANGTTVSQLAAANGIANPDLIHVGQNVNVSGGQAPTAPAAAPTVNTPAPVSNGNSAKAEIAQRESGGNPNAVNPSSGTVGAFQCHPAYHACPPLGDYEAQSRWADQYVAERYGSWDAALAHHNANGWY